MRPGFFKPFLRLLFCLPLLAFTTLGQTNTGKAPAHHYTLVPAESSFTVFVAKAGLLSGIAHDHNIGVKGFSGEINVPGASFDAGSVQLEVQTESLTLLDNISEKDRAEITKNMRGAVLETAKFPKVVFRSTSLTGFTPKENGASFTLNGDLTLHGITKRLALPVTVVQTGQTLRITGQYTLHQTDFGITPYSAALGTIKVKNDVVIKFNLVAKS
ncbi:MAG: YceI family protein [Acidobacteria bacterium]|nr:YceI family protein [Acidobacteriota bacterium]MBI3427754.1 YceI family protein [Acidobacteriota bacterium]